MRLSWHILDVCRGRERRRIGEEDGSSLGHPRQGRDIVDDGPPFDDSSDEISGGPGDDVMDAFNDPAVSDVVHCGSGDDRAYTDGSDLIADDCEEVIRGPHPDAWDRSPFQPVPLRR